MKIDTEQYAKLLQAERTVADLLPLIPKAEECGVNCDRIRAEIEVLQQQIAALKKNFGPQTASSTIGQAT